MKKIIGGPALKICVSAIHGTEMEIVGHPRLRFSGFAAYPVRDYISQRPLHLVTAA